MWQILDEINFCMYYITEWHMDFMPAGILFTMLMWGLSLVITVILSKIPILRRLI